MGGILECQKVHTFGAQNNYYTPGANFACFLGPAEGVAAVACRLSWALYELVLVREYRAAAHGSVHKYSGHFIILALTWHYRPTDASAAVKISKNDIKLLKKREKKNITPQPASSNNNVKFQHYRSTARSIKIGCRNKLRTLRGRLKLSGME